MVKMLAFLLMSAVFHHAIGSGSGNFLLENVENLSPAIRIVKNCGNWQYAQQEGYYRLIIGDVHNGAGSEAYIQFVTHPDQDNASKIIKTLAFPELNNDHSQYYFQTVDCSKIGKFTYIDLRGMYEHDEVERIHHLSIKLIDMNRYQIIEKKN